jgi:hypothetical protein
VNGPMSRRRQRSTLGAGAGVGVAGSCSVDI